MKSPLIRIEVRDIDFNHCYTLNQSNYHILGSRRTQEDRFCIGTKLIDGHDDVSFLGVFDGTVGRFLIDTL